MNQYEAMFLFDPTFGNAFEKCEAEIRRLMERVQAEMLFCRKWSETRLAFRIEGRKRGVYVLVYFKAAPDKIVTLERDAKLSERILRLLVLRADHMTREAMERVLPSHGAEPVKADGVTGKASKTVSGGDRPLESKTAPNVETKSIATETAVADKPEDEPTQIA